MNFHQFFNKALLQTVNYALTYVHANLYNADRFLASDQWLTFIFLKFIYR